MVFYIGTDPWSAVAGRVTGFGPGLHRRVEVWDGDPLRARVRADDDPLRARPTCATTRTLTMTCQMRET